MCINIIIMHNIIMRVVHKTIWHKPYNWLTKNKVIN